MRAGFFGLILTLVPLILPADDPRSQVEKAIQARGGEKELAQIVAVEAKVRGRIFRGQITYPFGATIISQLPDQYKHVMNYERDGETVTQAQVYSGNHVWLKARNIMQPLDDKLIDALQRGRYAERLTQLTALKDKTYHLTPLGESKASGHDVIGVQVDAPNKTPVKLFFDKASGLLIKTEHRQMDPQTLEEVNQETYYSDYRVPDTAESDETVLKKARIEIKGPALLEHLRKLKSSGVDPEQIRPLIQKLGDDSFEVREKATDALIAIGEPAVPFLQTAVKSNDLEVSRRAEQCLRAIRKDPAERHGEEAVWIALVRTLARTRHAGAVEALLDFLPQAASPEVEREVRFAIRQLASRDGLPDPALERALKDKDSRRRQAAAEALGQAVPPPGSRLLLPNVKYPMKGVTYRDGRKFMEWEVREIIIPNKIDDKEFAMP